ncbi:centrin [Chloropicon primus]|nr:centrin [Chloropicon primus]
MVSSFEFPAGGKTPQQDTPGGGVNSILMMSHAHSGSSLSKPSGTAPESVRSKLRVRRKRLTDDEEQELRGAFEVFDKKREGVVKYRETKALIRALGFETSKGEVRDLFRLYERDAETEGLEFFEFREIMMDKILERDPQEEHLKAFHLFDKDGSGKISLRDLRLLARQIGEKMTDESLLDMIDEFDLDGDGEIDQQEFVRIMANDDIDLDVDIL